MYKILFIDEQQEDIDYFKDYVDATKTKEGIEVIAEYPLESLDEMIELIIKHNPDALIVDYMLNEYREDINYNVPYTGVQLVRELTSIRDRFPCFIMTSFDDNAIRESEDVNIVYIKDILHNSAKDTGKANFLERVESQINHYKAKIKDADEKLYNLIELRNSGNATIEDETEIIRLDTFLEGMIDKRNAIPEQYKTLSNTQKLDEILTKVDELIERFESKDDK